MSRLHATPARARWLLAALLALLLTAAVLLWRLTPLAELASAERLLERIGSFRHAAWAPLALLAVYVIGGIVAFPLTVLIAVTALLFAPSTAVLLSLAGSLASAATVYGLGSRFLGTTLKTALGRGMDKVSAALEDRSIVAVALVRMIPVAPFTVVNLAAGSIGVPFRDYMVGSTLGLMPGILALTAFGHQLRAIWQRPTVGNVAMLAAIIVAWVALSLLLQRAASAWRRARRRRKESAA